MFTFPDTSHSSRQTFIHVQLLTEHRQQAPTPHSDNISPQMTNRWKHCIVSRYLQRSYSQKIALLWGNGRFWFSFTRYRRRHFRTSDMSPHMYGQRTRCSRCTLGGEVRPRGGEGRGTRMVCLHREHKRKIDYKLSVGFTMGDSTLPQVQVLIRQALNFQFPRKARKLSGRYVCFLFFFLGGGRLE